MIKRIMTVVLILLIVRSGTAAAMEPTDEQVMYYEPTHEITVDDALAVAAMLPEYDEATDELARLVRGEGGNEPRMEQAAIIWCVLNRVDAGHRGYDIISVIQSPSQFTGYNPNRGVREDLKELAVDVVTRWLLEKRNVKDVGRVLPKNYLWFASHGDGRNWFRYWYNSDSDNYDGSYWGWELPNPYE